MTGTDIGELAQPALPELPVTAVNAGMKEIAANMVAPDQQALVVAKATRAIEAEGVNVVILAQLDLRASRALPDSRAQREQGQRVKQAQLV